MEPDEEDEDLGIQEELEVIDLMDQDDLSEALDMADDDIVEVEEAVDGYDRKSITIIWVMKVCGLTGPEDIVWFYM